MATLKSSLHVERAKKRITQEELAKRVGTTRQTICSIENGKSEPSLGLAFRIARFFGLDINKIFELEDGKTSRSN